MPYETWTPKRVSLWLGLSALLLWANTGCLPEPEPAIDEATVIGDNTSVRLDAASSARTLFTLDAGARVSILEKRGSWYLVRDPDRLEGWMDESTLFRDSNRDAMARALVEAEGQPVQNTARALDAVNLRMAPGRDTDIVRRLRRGSALQVLDRATTPRPDSEAIDVWFEVRPSDEEIGWVFGPLIQFDAPEPLLPYMEGRTYTAVFPLMEITDPETGPQTVYLVGERRAQADPALAYDGVRVFVWNLDEHAYATTLRLPNVRGVYPIELTGDAASRGFRIPVLTDDGSVIHREFTMRGTIPRETN